ncbi:hypothetical protein [Caudoviricetes sp.]|nr:hypothetical protein [Caudoviricetes sp.]
MEPRDFKRISAFPRFPSPLRKETAEMGFRRLFYTPPPVAHGYISTPRCPTPCVLWV